MLFKRNPIDERVRMTVGRWSNAWLGVTQLLLFGVIFYRLYILGQPDAELNDFRLVLAVSVLGSFGLHLYLGGLLPVPTWKGALICYLVLVLTICGVCLPLYGLPAAEQWASTWLPALLGPALFISAYWLVAFLGERRVEKLLDSSRD